MRKKYSRRIAHRLAQTLSENGTKPWTCLMTRLYFRVPADHSSSSLHNRGSPIKESH